MWVNLYASKITDSATLKTISFPIDYPQGSDHQVARATSLGEATAVIEGAKLSEASMAYWFKMILKSLFFSELRLL